jgi:hypothetical protein
MGGLDWIDVAQDRERWRALVIAVLNLRVPQNVGNAWLRNFKLIQGLCSMEGVSKEVR